MNNLKKNSIFGKKGYTFGAHCRALEQPCRNIKHVPRFFPLLLHLGLGTTPEYFFAWTLENFVTIWTIYFLARRPTCSVKLGSLHSVCMYKLKSSTGFNILQDFLIWPLDVGLYCSYNFLCTVGPWIKSRVGMTSSHVFAWEILYFS